MAGSYRMCINKEDNSFRFDLIENMGDAHEACEMMVFMIQSLATEEAIKYAEFEYYKSRNPTLTREFFDRSRS